MEARLSFWSCSSLSMRSFWAFTAFAKIRFSRSKDSIPSHRFSALTICPSACSFACARPQTGASPLHVLSGQL